MISDLKANRRPQLMQPDEAAVYDLVTELSRDHAVSDATFAHAKELLGEQQVVDLTALTGTYVTVAMILAMAEQGVPADREAPFKPGSRSCWAVRPLPVRWVESTVPLRCVSMRLKSFLLPLTSQVSSSAKANDRKFSDARGYWKPPSRA